MGGVRCLRLLNVPLKGSPPQGGSSFPMELVPPLRDEILAHRVRPACIFVLALTLGWALRGMSLQSPLRQPHRSRWAKPTRTVSDILVEVHEYGHDLRAAYFSEVGRATAELSQLLHPDRLTDSRRRPATGMTLDRSTMLPFASGDGFRAFADHIVDETTGVHPNLVANLLAGDSIFVKSDFLSAFFHEMHPRIFQPYVLVTHNSDWAVPSEPRIGAQLDAYLDSPMILAWYTVNPSRLHPKLVPLPLGLQNAFYGSPEPNSPLTDYMAVLPDAPPLLAVERNILLFIGHEGHTNNSTRLDWAVVYPEMWAYTDTRPLTHIQFLSLLQRSRFVLSPGGQGDDCHRTWEALAMGAVPVVLNLRPFSPLYATLPVLMVEDLGQLNRSFLESWTLPAGATYRKLWLRPHIAAIESHKHAVAGLRNLTR